MTDVFVSYAHADWPRVERVVNGLTALGYTVWWDHTIPPGKTWDESIAVALNEAKSVLVIWSAAAAKSDWVKEEATLALKARKYLAVSIDGTEPPTGFTRRHATDLSRWKGDLENPQWNAVTRELAANSGAKPVSPTLEPATRNARGAYFLVAACLAVAGLTGAVAFLWLELRQQSEQNARTLATLDAMRSQMDGTESLAPSLPSAPVPENFPAGNVYLPPSTQDSAPARSERADPCQRASSAWEELLENSPSVELAEAALADIPRTCNAVRVSAAEWLVVRRREIAAAEVAQAEEARRLQKAVDYFSDDWKAAACSNGEIVQDPDSLAITVDTAAKRVRIIYRNGSVKEYGHQFSRYNDTEFTLYERGDYGDRSFLSRYFPRDSTSEMVIYKGTCYARAS